MENWFYVIGALVLLGVGLDLVRRTRSASRDSMEMDLHMQRGVGKGDPLLRGDGSGTEHMQEISVGSARKIIRAEDSQKIIEKKIVKQAERVEPKIGGELPLENTQKLRRNPTVSTLSTDDDDAHPVPMLMEIGDRHEALFSDDDPFMGGSSPILSRPRVVPRKAGEPEGLHEVLVINVMARQPNGLQGVQLLESVLSSGLRFGEMNIFHYYVSDEDDTPLFSMANIVKPGVFDLNNMSSFHTPGISLFMTLPLGANQISPMETFDKMLACAKKIAKNLDGELRDERRSVMTGQTIEHCRQRISDFSRKKLSRSGKFTAH